MKKFISQTLAFALLLALLPAAARSQKPAQSASLLGKTDFHAFQEEAPAPPMTIDEAARRAFGANVLQPDPLALDRYYQPFTDHLRSADRQYELAYGNKLQAYQEAGGAADLRRQTEAEVNKNPIISTMGGYEKVSQMSEKEAEAAARRAAAQYTANPFAASGVQSAGMTALYQKVASDPDYAARFNRMSEKEKEAELRKFMASDQPQVKTPAEMEAGHRAFEAQLRERDEVRHAMDVQQRLAAWMQEIYQAKAVFEEARQAQSAAHAAIDADHRVKYERIPERVYGEAGRQRDAEQVKQLSIQTATRHRAAAVTQLQQLTAHWNDLKAAYKQVTSDYLDYLSEHAGEVNASLRDLARGTNTELALASFERSLLGLAGDLAGLSRDLTGEAGGWERNYQETMATYGR